MDLNEAKEKYKKLYIEYAIRKGTSIPEMDELFNIILDGFNDSNVKMDDFIQSIVDENTVQKPSELDLLKQRQEMAEEALLTLSDMLLSR